AYRGADEFVSLAGTGEFYLLTTYAEGRPYAGDLRRLARTGMATAVDIERMHALVDYLAKLHAPKPRASRAVYARSIRDTLGGGEGVFGISDSYPDAVPGAPLARLERIEELCLSWRFRLRGRAERLARIHGDFHPFNVLFDDNGGLAVLDTSRGSMGDPADDVSAMAINFAFFALGRPGAWRDVLQSFWYGFWSHYAARSGDEGVYDVAPPFLAWRALVLANPKWYPDLAAGDRQRILAFAENVLGSGRLVPAVADEYFDA
ncbi:MAG TPA: phosphotransferase, partial [Polyangiaceae bacterium]